MIFSIKPLVLLVVMVWGVEGECPSSTAVSPCVCREETAGRILDCASVTSGDQLATLMQNDMGDPHWDFLQVILDGRSAALDSLPANTFADKTLTHIWIGESNIASVDAAAFTGQETNLLEILMGATPSLTSFPFASLETLTAFFLLQITSSGITSITSMGAPPALSQVKITNAAISSIEAGAFSAVPNLAIVDLSGSSDLTEISDGVFESSTAQPWSLYLDGCSVSTVSDTAFSGSLPTTVGLRNNALTTLSESAFGAVVDNMATAAAEGTAAGGLRLAGNAMVCDCSIAWFATDATRAAQVKNVVCANDEVAGTALEDLPDDFFASC